MDLGTLVSATTALALHVAVVLALNGAAEDRVGAGGEDLEAASVEVTMVTASALESRARTAQQGVARATFVDLDEGLPAPAGGAGGGDQRAADAPKPEVAEPKALESAERDDKPGIARETVPEAESRPAETPVPTPPPPIAAAVDDSPEAPDAITLPPPAAHLEPTEPAEHPPEPVLANNAETPQKPEVLTPAPPVAPPESPPPEKEPELKVRRSKADSAPPAQPSSAAPRGGAVARQSASAERPAAAAAAASPGAISAFTKSIVEALAKGWPKRVGTRRKGTVKIAFGIAEDGSLAFVRVAKSSGSGVLDEAALSAIKSAGFPAPPAGLSLDQRTYEVPYHFR